MLNELAHAKTFADDIAAMVPVVSRITVAKRIDMIAPSRIGKLLFGLSFRRGSLWHRS